MIPEGRVGPVLRAMSRRRLTGSFRVQARSLPVDSEKMEYGRRGPFQGPCRGYEAIEVIQ